MSRPRLNLQLTTFDKSMVAIGRALILATWVLIIFTYLSLPESIPIHFNRSGQVDGHGNKLLILLIPLISSILFVGLSILIRHPHNFSYPVKIKEGNALSLYTLATRMIRLLQVAIGVIFLNTAIGSILLAKEEINSLPVWLFPLELLTLFSILVYFIVRMFRMSG